MARTSAALIGGIIEVETGVSLDPFIKAAAILVDKVAAKNILSKETLKVIETWLAAHFYCMRDPRTVSEKAGQVQASYQSKVDLFLSNSNYGQQAIVLDTTGTLRAINAGVRPARLLWLGTPIEE